MPGDISGDAQAGGDHASNDGGYGSAAADSSGGTVDASIASSPTGSQMAFAAGALGVVMGVGNLAAGNPLGAAQIAGGFGAMAVAVSSGMNPAGPGPSLADAHAVGGGFNAFAARDMTSLWDFEPVLRDLQATGRIIRHLAVSDALSSISVAEWDRLGAIVEEDACKLKTLWEAVLIQINAPVAGKDDKSQT